MYILHCRAYFTIHGPVAEFKWALTMTDDDKIKMKHMHGNSWGWCNQPTCKVPHQVLRWPTATLVSTKIARSRIFDFVLGVWEVVKNKKPQYFAMNSFFATTWSKPAIGTQYQWFIWCKLFPAVFSAYLFLFGALGRSCFFVSLLQRGKKTLPRQTELIETS